MCPEPGTEQISITSLLGDRRGALVQLVWGSQVAQLTPEEARAHALRILECAEAAEQDAFLFDWLRTSENGGEPVKPAMAARIIGLYREWRAQREST